jgi:hypothetical protein
MMKLLYLLITAMVLPSLLTFGIASAIDMGSPVFFMKTNSTAKIYTEYRFPEGAAEQPDITYNQVDVSPQVYPFNLSGGFVSTNGSVTISADPNSIPFSQNNTNVTLTITAKNNIKGIYALFFTDQICSVHEPIVIGLNESQVDPLTLESFYHSGPAFCPMETTSPPTVNIVGYSEMIPEKFYKIFRLHGLHLASPLEQVRSGTSPSEITCDYGLQRLYNAHNGSPACVTPDTANILIERGWAS